MIPKIIHYIWLGSSEYPAIVQQCIASWKRYLPDYELRLWTDDTLREMKSAWLDECVASGKWAFAADFIRLWAIREYGGIYLDTDCLVCRSFDDLLSNKMFIGRENSVHIDGRRTENYLTSCCFGAEAHHPFIEQCYAYYAGKHFVTSTDKSMPISLQYDLRIINYVQSELAKSIGYNALLSADGRQSLSFGVEVYPKEYFDIGNASNGGYCSHLALGSWRENVCEPEKTTWQYKIRWRVEALLRRMVERCGYLMVKKM